MQAIVHSLCRVRCCFALPSINKKRAHIWILHLCERTGIYWSHLQLREDRNILVSFDNCSDWDILLSGVQYMDGIARTMFVWNSNKKRG